MTNHQGFIILISRPEGKAGYIQVDSTFFTLLPLDSSKYILIKSKPSLYQINDCATPESEGSGVDYCEDEANTCPAVITVLVIETPEARTYFQTLGNSIIARLLGILGVAITNVAFFNSLVVNKTIEQRWTFVDWFPLSDDIDDDIIRLAADPGIQQLRQDFHADLVVMLTDDRYAFSGVVNEIGPHINSAYALVEAPSMFRPRWTFAHELAHLLGARHNRSANGGNDNEAICAHGWRFTDTGGRMVMG